MNTPTKLPLLGLNGITLRSGAHHDREEGVCAMEAAAWMAGEPHSDKPKCVCPVIGAFMRSWNDGLRTDEDRNRILKPLLPLTIGTRATQEVEKRRSQLAYDWVLRVYTLAWLEAAKLDEHAKAVRENPSLENLSAAESAARSAAESAAESAAWSAVRSAAESAAWSAVRSAAESALRDVETKLQESAADLLRRMVECK